MAKKKKKSPSSRLPIQAKRFIQNVGHFIEYWGFMRLQGEIWALVFISNKPLTSSEVANLLGVSKASVSLAMRELIAYRVILQNDDSGKRNLPLVVNEDLPQVIAGVLRMRELQLLGQTRANLSLLDIDDSAFPLDPKRLSKISSLIESAETLLHTVIGMNQEFPPSNF